LVIAIRQKHNEKPEKVLRDDYARRTIGKARQAASQNTSADRDVNLSKLLAASGFSSPSSTFGPRAIAKLVNDVERQELQWFWSGRMCLGRAKEHDRKAAEREVMVKKITKIIAELEREEATIRKQMLVP
jgi:hypothetical protein